MRDFEREIQKRLRSRKYFTCPVMHVRMRKQECLDRQDREVKKVSTRRGTILVYNLPEDRYCRSKAWENGPPKCLMARQIKRELKGNKK